MKNDNQILPISKVEVSTNYLKIAPDATDEDLKNIFGAISKANSGSLWWIGDFLAQVEMRKGEAYAKAYSMTDYAHSTLWDAKRVCSKLTPDKRVFNLSYQFYKEALKLTKSNVELTLQFLKQATEESLTISQMRKQIRLSLATNLPPEELKPTYTDMEFAVLIDACRTITRCLKSGKMNEFQRLYFLGELEKFNEMAAKLKEVA